MYAFVLRQVFKNVGSVPHTGPSTFMTIKITSAPLPLATSRTELSTDCNVRQRDHIDIYSNVELNTKDH